MNSTLLKKAGDPFREKHPVKSKRYRFQEITMKLKERYDVIIAGTGPAGAGAARALKGSGLETLAVERSKLPRYKMCSGIVFPSSRKIIEQDFGKIPPNVMCEPVITKGNRVFITNDTPMIDVPFSAFDEGDGLEEEGFNTWRADLDLWLMNQSDAEIADQCSFESFRREDGEYLVELGYQGIRSLARTRYLIGADGTLSRVRRSIFPEFNKKINKLPNYEEIHTGSIDLEPGWLYLFMDRSVTGYFATVFHKDDKIVVVTGVNEKESVKNYFKAFKSHLEQNHGLKSDSVQSRHGIVLTDMSARKNYCLGVDNVLLAGEAGGFLRGGEGITSSLVSGKAAGEAVLESVKKKRPAIKYFRELAADELQKCEHIHASLSAIMGYNVFMRP